MHITLPEKNVTSFKHIHQSSRVQNEDTEVNGFHRENIKAPKEKKKEKKI